MARPTKPDDVHGNYRMQIYDADEAATVANAIKLLESRIGVRLTHTQALVALAAAYLRNTN